MFVQICFAECLCCLGVSKKGAIASVGVEVPEVLGDILIV